MEIKDIKTLIDLMRKNDLSVFKMEQEGFKITLKRGCDFQPVLTAPVPVQAPVSSLVPVDCAPDPTPGVGLKEILSPMVGTVYFAASPDSRPYVEAGQEVTPDTVVCLIEAMKVMNEIKAEAKGIVTQVLIENGKPVEFGQPLFKIRAT